MPFDSEYLIALLDKLNMKVVTVEHPPLRTVEESRRLRGDLKGGHVKNLFLKDKKKQYWLLVALEDTVIDLKATATLLGTQQFYFASPANLEQILGIVPGAVSPFAVINDQSKLVSVVLDQKLIKTSPLNFHPLRNDRTTTIDTSDFLRFLDEVKHPPRIICIPG